MTVARAQGKVGRLAHRTPLLRGLPPEVGVLSAIAFCVALGFGIVAPAIPVFARAFGVSAFLAGAVVSAFAMMRLISSPGAGAAINRIGERRVLAAGLAIVAVSSLAAGFSQSYVQLIVMRGLGGVGSSMFTVSAMALLLRTVGPDLRGRATGAYQAGFLFGGVTGPALGGAVVGISIRAPFFVYAGTLAAATAVCWFYLKDPPPREDGDPAGQPPSAQAVQPLPLRNALRDRAYWAALATNLGNGFSIFGLRSALVPLFVVEGMRRGPSLTGVGFLVAAAVQAVLLLPAGRWADERGRRPAMILGSAASVAGMVLLAAGTGLWTFFAAMAVFGVAGAFLGPAPTAVVGDITHGRPGGTVVAVYQMVSDFGAIIGPLAAGLVLDAAGFGAAFAVGAVIVGLGLVAAVAMPETLGRRDSGSPASDSGTMAQ